jgi:hypothetical protein
MSLLTIYHNSDCYEVKYTSTSITHIDKLLGDSHVRREVVFEKLPKEVQDEILTTINIEEE